MESFGNTNDNSRVDILIYAFDLETNIVFKILEKLSLPFLLPLMCCNFGTSYHINVSSQKYT